jgi:hypothetical protein
MKMMVDIVIAADSMGPNAAYTDISRFVESF